MTDPKHPQESPADRAIRLERLEKKVDAILKQKGLAPHTPEEAKAIEELAKKIDENEARYLKGLMQQKPSKGGPGIG